MLFIRRTIIFSVSITIATLGFIFFATPAVFAATVTWDGGGGDGVWSTATNWSDDAAPGSADDVVIDTAVTVKITAATTINSLVLGVSAGNVASVLQFDYDAIGGSPLTVNGNVTMYGTSKITTTDNTTATAYRANLDVNGDFDLKSNASIDLSAKGFTGGAPQTAGNGTGPGLYSNYVGGGGAHAGTGGKGSGSSLDTGGSAYGSATNPITLGSGGAGGDVSGTEGGDGGGAVKIDVAGTFTLNGMITADGAAGGSSATNAGGGGGGGAVQVIAETLSGSGTATVDGGAGGNGVHRDAGGGGGGYIYVRYASTTLSAGDFNTMFSVLGGSVDNTHSSSPSILAVAGQNGTLTQVDLPVFSSAVYEDNNGDGTVDQVVLTFDESVTVGGTLANSRFTLTSASGANGFAGSLSGNASASGTDVTITIDSADANETGHTTVPTIAYDDNGDDATDNIQDADGNSVQTFTAQNVTDGAAPVFVSAEATSDTNIQITMSETIGSVNFGLASDWTASGITSSAVAINGGLIDLTVSSLGDTAFTAADFAFDTAGGSYIRDSVPNSTSAFSLKAIADGQAPTIANFSYGDNDNDGKIDVITVGFSEMVTGASVLSASNLLITTDGDFDNATFGADTADLITESENSESVTLGTESTVIDTAEDSGTLAISTQGVFSLTDGSGNTYSTEEVQSGSIGDGAAPVIKTFTYQDDDADGKIDRFLVTFSEAIDDTSILAAENLALANVGDFTGADFGSDGTDLTTVDGATTLTVVLGTEATAMDTNDSGSIAISIQDGVGNFTLVDDTGSANTNSNIGAQSWVSFEDGAAPVLLSRATLDNNTDGTVDYLKLVWTEDLNDSTVTASDFITFISTASPGSLLETVSSGTPSTGNETDTADDETIYIAEASGTETITANATGLKFRVRVGGTVDDAAGNTSVAEGSATLSDDAAAPILLSSSPANSDTDVARDEDLVLTFSEAIDTASFTYTCCGAASDPGSRVNTWTVNDKVNTITHADFTFEDVVTLNITAAPDTSANSFAGAGASAADPFTYTVVANSAPTLDSNVPDQSLTEDTNVTGAFDLDTYFSDVDTEHNDQYTCTAANDLAVGLGTMTINANRTVDFTLAANANGTDTIQFSCEDDATAAVSSNVITVTVAAVNDTPTLASNIPNITVTEDTTSTAAVDLDTYFTDVDTGDTCTYSVLDDWSKGTMTVNGDGTVDFVPTANTIGDDTIKFRCTDDSSATADTNSITVTITNTNDAPSITGLADISIAEGTTLVVLAQGVDVDSSTLSLAAADGDGSFTAKGYTVSELFSDNGDSTGTFTWTPGYTDAGAYPLGVTANDGITTASASMTITVTPANSDPEFDETNPLPNLAMVKGTPATDVFDLDDYFTDLDEETLTYSVIGNTNITATFNEGSVTLEATSAGTESLIFVATDAAGETANSNTIVVTVAAGVTLDGIDHIIGSNTKKGKIKLYNEEGEIIAQWKAFPKGGVVPRIAEIDGEGYVFAVKRRFGSTMHAYNLSGDEVLKKHRLSPKLHWRKLATGNVDSDKTDEEIVVMTERGSTLYFKIFSFNATKKKFTLKKKSKYRGKVIADQKYTASVVKKQVRLSDKDGNVIFVWTPYENTLSASMLRR